MNLGFPFSLSAKARSRQVAAYECTTLLSAPRSCTIELKSASVVSLGSWLLKVITNLRQSALSTGRWSLGVESSGTMCSWKNCPMLTSWLVDVAPDAAVLPLTVRAMIRYIAQSLDFQFAAGFCWYSRTRTSMYAEHSWVSFSGNFSVRLFTSSQLDLLLVSESLPSISLRTYSTKFISKSSSSSSRILKLGITTPSHICFMVSPSSKSL